MSRQQTWQQADALHLLCLQMADHHLYRCAIACLAVTHGNCLQGHSMHRHCSLTLMCLLVSACGLCWKHWCHAGLIWLDQGWLADGALPVELGQSFGILQVHVHCAQQLHSKVHFGSLIATRIRSTLDTFYVQSAGECIDQAQEYAPGMHIRPRTCCVHRAYPANSQDMFCTSLHAAAHIILHLTTANNKHMCRCRQHIFTACMKCCFGM